jgi:hypothetical protein
MIINYDLNELLINIMVFKNHYTSHHFLYFILLFIYKILTLFFLSIMDS